MPSIFDDRARAALVARLETLRPDAPRRWGRMTAHQAVCHLSDGYRMALGDRLLPDQSNPLFRTVIRFVALTAPLPWPKGAPTAPGLDQEAGGGTSPRAFGDDRAELLGLMERFVASRGTGLHPHLAFGALSPGEWGRWAWRHTDHHLRQFGA